MRLDVPNMSISHGTANCTALYVDSFGNVILNLAEEDITRLGAHVGDHVVIETKQGQFPGLVGRTYSDISHAQIGVIRGSQGHLEIAMRESSAAARLGLKPLDQIEMRLS